MLLITACHTEKVEKEIDDALGEKKKERIAETWVVAREVVDGLQYSKRRLNPYLFTC